MNLSVFLNFFAQYKYPFVFLITIPEGPIVSMICGILIKLSIMSFIPAYLSVMAGDIVGDSLWYYLGKKYAHALTVRYGKYLGVTEQKLERTQEKFRNHQGKILFISKLTSGFGFPMVTLMGAGMSHVPFKKFLTYNFLGQLVWSGALLFIGYFFGQAIQQINKDLQILGILGALIIFILLLKGFTTYMRSRNTE